MSYISKSCFKNNISKNNFHISLFQNLLANFLSLIVICLLIFRKHTLWIKSIIYSLMNLIVFVWKIPLHAKTVTNKFFQFIFILNPPGFSCTLQSYNLMFSKQVLIKFIPVPSSSPCSNDCYAMFIYTSIYFWAIIAFSLRVQL